MYESDARHGWDKCELEHCFCAAAEARRKLKLVFHKINPKVVKKSVNARIKEFERQRVTDIKESAKDLIRYKADVDAGKSKNWGKPPETAEQINAMYDEWIEQEKTYYSLARVIESNGKFRLFYGKEKYSTNGTGPFDSLEKAVSWFSGQGR